MVDRSRDWLKQAERDLAQAVDSRQSERHEWACFASQQAAEKAVKALHLHLGQEAWGHVVAQLLRELPETNHPPPALIEQAKVLDTFYIASRYPNSHPSGAPLSAMRYAQCAVRRAQSPQLIAQSAEHTALVRPPNE